MEWHLLKEWRDNWLVGKEYTFPRTDKSHSSRVHYWITYIFYVALQCAHKCSQQVGEVSTGSYMRGIGGREKNSSCRLDLATIPVEASRLGIRKLNTFKCKLFTNCPWHFNQEWGHLWRRLVGTKYDKLVRCCTLQLVKHSLWLWSLKGRQLEQDGFFH